MRIVRLTEAERRICKWVGEQRFLNAQRNHRDAGKGPSHVDLTSSNHIRGAQCEWAASIALNMYWRPTIGSIKDKDVGGLVQVRSTVLSNGRLIIKPTDLNDPFVLIVVEGESYRAAGWIMAEEARAKYPLCRQFGDAAYFVEQTALHDLESLKERC